MVRAAGARPAAAARGAAAAGAAALLAACALLGPRHLALTPPAGAAARPPARKASSAWTDAEGLEAEPRADFHEVASEAEAEAAAEAPRAGGAPAGGPAAPLAGGRRAAGEAARRRGPAGPPRGLSTCSLARLEAPLDFDELRRQVSTKARQRTMRGPQLYEAIRRLREAGELRSAGEYAAVLKAMVHRKSGGFSDEAVELLEDMRQQSIQPTADHFCSAMAAARWDQEWELALALHDQMKLSGIDASQLTYAYLLNALAHGGAWEPALQVLESDMPRDGVEPNLRLFTSALSACEFGGQWLAAMRVFENVYKADMTPDVVTWTALINACARGGQLQLVKECLEQMVVEGVTPNVITYNSVIRGCVEMGELKKAVKVREALVADGLMPDTACYDATLKGYARFGLWEQALAEFQEMKAEPYKLVPQVGTYISMFNVLDKADRWKESMQLLKGAMSFPGFQNIFTHMEDLDTVPPKAAYISALKCCEENGNWQEALRILGHMKARGVAAGAVVSHLVTRISRNVENDVIENKLRIAVEELQELVPPQAQALPLQTEAPLWARD